MTERENKTWDNAVALFGENGGGDVSMVSVPSLTGLRSHVPGATKRRSSREVIVRACCRTPQRHIYLQIAKARKNKDN